MTEKLKIKRSIYQPITGKVLLDCGRCKNRWFMNWAAIRLEGDETTCPTCGLKSYIGDKNDYN